MIMVLVLAASSNRIWNEYDYGTGFRSIGEYNMERIWLWCLFYKHRRIEYGANMCIVTVCPRSLDPFHMVTLLYKTRQDFLKY